jgi:hypothetical protein
MLASPRPMRLLLIGLAACAVTWAFASVASAKPIDPAWNTPVASPTTAAASPATAGVGDHSVPDPRQVDAVLADLRSERAARSTGSSSPSSDTETVALVLSIIAVMTALGAVTLTVTRPRGRALGT